VEIGLYTTGILDLKEVHLTSVKKVRRQIREDMLYGLERLYDNKQVSYEGDDFVVEQGTVDGVTGKPNIVYYSGPYGAWTCRLNDGRLGKLMPCDSIATALAMKPQKDEV